MNRKIVILLVLIIVVYSSLGLAFHLRWSDELTECSKALREQGEFVEPEIHSTVVGLIFDVVFWPIYSAANVYHDGTPFATPCTH